MLKLQGIRLLPDTAAFSHDFADRAITVVLGGNGSGKTRLVRTIAGLDEPAEGRLLLDGEDITAESPGARSVALVYQVFVNYPQWTVADNIASPLKAAACDRAELEERVATISRQLKLEDLLGRLPSELSGGQQQRVAIGRALAKGARVLVMDEPLVNLDYKLRESLTLELRGLLEAAGITVIYTSSDPRDAFALGDELLLLDEHAAVQTGTPLGVYEAPASPRSVELMSDPGANRVRRGDRLALVRPEHLYLERSAASDHCFEGEVLSRETNGAETFLHLSVEDEHWVARLDGLVELPEDRPLLLYADAASVFEFEAAYSAEGAALG